MITINCGFSRTVREPHKAKRIQCQNVTGIKLNLSWDSDHEAIRKELMKHKPEGEGWGISGYTCVETCNIVPTGKSFKTKYTRGPANNLFVYG